MFDFLQSTSVDPSLNSTLFIFPMAILLTGCYGLVIKESNWLLALHLLIYRFSFDYHVLIDDHSLLEDQ